MAVPARNDVSEVAVTVGVDAHLDEHVAVALDQLGRRLGVLSVPTTGAGYAKLLGWAQALGELEGVGIEGAGSFGAGLARLLRARHFEVLEVGRPKRRDRHRHRRGEGHGGAGGDDPGAARFPPLGRQSLLLGAVRELDVLEVVVAQHIPGVEDSRLVDKRQLLGRSQ